MRAREWLVASQHGAPEEYDIPTLPDWRVCRPDGGGVAFVDGEAYIAAEHPVRVRR